MQPEPIDLGAFTAEVVRELRMLRRRLPEWFPPGPYPDDRWPLDPLERREAERLERLGRVEREAWRERTRQRVERERKHPWREQDRWGLRKRVWSERRAKERVLLERRERALLERADELSTYAFQVAGWLRELCELEPAVLTWCQELMQQIEEDDITLPELIGLWRQRRRALERRARELLAQADIRMLLRPALTARDLEALAKASIEPLLSVGAAIPRIPALFAAIAIQIDHLQRTGHWAEREI